VLCASSSSGTGNFQNLTRGAMILLYETNHYLMNNYSIIELCLEAYYEKIKEKNTRDIGKFLQFVAEGYARRWLKEECGIDSSCVKNDENGNEQTWDILTKNSIRDQVKYRGGKTPSGRPKLFLETTRRNSKKYAGAKSQS
jgi:hypothetical protein